MKLLIITQRLDKNDAVLGFFHRWIEEFAKEIDKVFVISQYTGNYSLPENVEVFSLGKEKKISKALQLFNFYRALFRDLKKADAVFVHMVPMWVVLGWPFFRAKRKKIFLWYTHKSVTFWLKFAEKAVVKIFTASPESFRLFSKKVLVVGHGIDIEAFQPRHRKTKAKNQKLIILSVGRIAKAKNQKTLLETADILANQKNFKNFEIQFIGAPILKQDQEYFEEIRKFASEKKLEKFVKFLGDVPHGVIKNYYEKADIFAHLSRTGSVDKVVLEAIVMGVPVYSSSEAFKNILPFQFLISDKPNELAEKIISFTPPPEEIMSALRDYAIRNHSLKNLISKITREMRIRKA
jgi:glycosyltransferase involved in cell wall biosynthesis